MSEEQKLQPTDPEVHGLVFYTDGGARPNPGFGGYGIHGYMYLMAVPKKGSGNPDHVLTEHGYYPKTDNQYPAVTPVHYVDGYGSFGYPVTNNVAELVAATMALGYAFEHNVQIVRVYTDAEYVRKGMGSWVDIWKKYGWKRSDGSDIPNVAEWKKLDFERSRLEARGTVVEFHWVKGHNDHLGNETADRFATLGVMHSRGRKTINEIKSTPADGYWKYDVERHPFIGFRRMYFNTRRDNLTAGEYYLGEHGKDDDLLGKRMSDGAFSVIRLKTPDPAVEMILDYTSRLADNTDNLMILQLDSLFRPAIHEEVTNYGEYAMERPEQHRLDLLSLKGDPIVRELRPAKLAYRAVENVGFLIEKLNAFQNKADDLVVTDLTPILYETTVKTTGKKETSKLELKSEYRVGFAALEVMANYKSVATGELCQKDLILTLGIDLLDRNRLKALESMNPRVSLVTWTESEINFRHATIIEVDDAIGIWAGMYSNLRVLT